MVDDVAAVRVILVKKIVSHVLNSDFGKDISQPNIIIRCGTQQFLISQSSLEIKGINLQCQYFR